MRPRDRSRLSDCSLIPCPLNLVDSPPPKWLIAQCRKAERLTGPAIDGFMRCGMWDDDSKRTGDGRDRHRGLRGKQPGSSCVVGPPKCAILVPIMEGIPLMTLTRSVSEGGCDVLAYASGWSRSTEARCGPKWNREARLEVQTCDDPGIPASAAVSATAPTSARHWHAAC